MEGILACWRAYFLPPLLQMGVIEKSAERMRVLLLRRLVG